MNTLRRLYPGILLSRWLAYLYIILSQYLLIDTCLTHFVPSVLF